MFSVTVSSLIMIYISLPLFVLFFIWFFFEIAKKDSINFEKGFKKKIVCPYCLNIFLATKEKKIVRCRGCEFLIDMKEGQTQ